MNQTADLTWEHLVEIEPGLEQLLADILQVHDNRRERMFCANQAWYRPGGFKNRLQKLVGFSAAGIDPCLQSSPAYDLAYHKLYFLLPACRNCGCRP